MMKLEKIFVFTAIAGLYVILSIFFINSVEAQTDICRTNVSAQIVESCFVCEGCGEYCSSSAMCNLTVNNPYKEIIVNNQEMTNQIAFHNYTITGDLVNESGKYDYSVACIDGTTNGSFQSFFVCNPPGIEPTESRTDSITRSIYLFFFLGILLIVGGWFTRRQLAPIRWSLYILGAISILISINIISVSLRDEVVNPQIVQLFDVITASTFYLYWFAAVVIFVMWILSILLNIQKMVQQKKIERFG